MYYFLSFKYLPVGTTALLAVFFLPHALRRLHVAAITVATAAAMGTAHAGYTVIDDDLFPNSVLEARNASLIGRASAFPDEYRVPFAQGRTGLGSIGRASLTALLPILRTASSIRVVGRPDAVPNARLAQARADALRTHLERVGVERARIVVEIDNTPNQVADRGTFLVDLFVVRDVHLPSSYAQDYVAPQPRRVAHSSPMDSPPQGGDSGQYSIPASRSVAPLRPSTPSSRSASQPTVPAAAVSGPAPDAALIAYINAAVSTGQMSAAVALQLLRSLAVSGQTSVQQDALASAPIPGAANNAPPGSHSAWLLDRQLSLFDNLDRWVRLAGWNPIQWSTVARELSHSFQVTQSVSVPGNFPDVLRRVADVTGLNICALPRQQVVRITESTVPCNN